MAVSKAEQVEINVIGSSLFGINNKISAEKTYNLYLSTAGDQSWMVNYPGFKKISEIEPNGEGRAIFNSIRGDFLIVVINAQVYRINSNLAPFPIAGGTLETLTGNVYIDENLNSQICIVDGKKAYIYNYDDNSFTTQNLQYTHGSPPTLHTLFPGYVSYHNTFFLFASTPENVNSNLWFAATYTNSTTITIATTNVFTLQTKPDVSLVVERLPGKGNNVLVMGSSVAEVWTQVGGIENYRRVQSFNIDYGVVAASTVASSEEQICWLAQNENNSPVIMVTDGGSSRRISTDGIDHALDQIKFPKESNAFFFRQDGHLFYQLTFYNPADNLSIIHDFTTGLFFHVSDQNLNFHPARQVVFYNEKSYFVSINDGDFYEMDGDLLTYNYSLVPNSLGEEIPRIRICKAVRKKDSERFRVGKFQFWMEQGVNNYYQDNPVIPRVDMSFSKNGGQSFSNVVGITLNAAGHYRNMMRYWKLGDANEFIIQLRFIGFQRFVVGPGVLSIY